MASNTSNTKLLSIALIIAGIGMALWGLQLSNSIGSEITKAVTGSDTDKVMTLYIAGATSLVVGAYLFFKR